MLRAPVDKRQAGPAIGCSNRVSLVTADHKGAFNATRERGSETEADADRDGPGQACSRDEEQNKQDGKQDRRQEDEETHHAERDPVEEGCEVHVRTDAARGLHGDDRVFEDHRHADPPGDRLSPMRPLAHPA